MKTEKIFLHKNYFCHYKDRYDESLSEKAKFAYVCIRHIVFESEEQTHISTYQLLDVVGLVPDESNLKFIRGCLHELNEEIDFIGYIKKEYSKDNFLIENKPFIVNKSKEKFIVAYTEDLQKIFSSKNRIDKKCKLTNLYVTVVSTFNNTAQFQSKLGFMSQNTLSDFANINHTSRDRYLNDLCTLEVLYIHKNVKSFADNECASNTNTYSRYADKDFCIEQGNKRNYYYLESRGI